MRYDTRRRSGVPGVIVFLLVTVAAVAFGGGGAILGYVIAAAQVAAEFRAKEPPAQNRPTITRDAFRTSVMGKTADEVIAAVGRPDSTQENGRNPTWYYYERTHDPLTKKVDYSAQLCFENGRVESVNY